MRSATHGLIIFCVVMLSACSSLPSWMGGGAREIKRAPGTRTDVLSGDQSLKADPAVAGETVQVPDQTNLDQWLSLNQAMMTAHVGLTGVTREQKATIGKGNVFSRDVVSAPVVAGGLVFAMDAAGAVSAHDEHDISITKWVDHTGRIKHDALGGGIAYLDGTVYATTGFGNLRALDAVTGNEKWNINVGAPVRGAPAVGSGTVVVLAADNQTLAYDAATGAPKWEHRGIRETAGYFSITSPVISDDMVIAVYSSGEVFALRLDSGSVLWNDTLASSSRTRAAAVFSGIDADPIVQEGVVVVTNAGGEMQASALLNGRPLWQQHIGAHSTPWSAGNVLYVLSDSHDVAAVMKRDGSIRWASSLARSDPSEPGKDITPPLYGPILSANAIIVLDGEGILTSFKPTDGSKIGTYELASGIVTSPVIANGAMYVITRDARLHKYY